MHFHTTTRFMFYELFVSMNNEVVRISSSFYSLSTISLLDIRLGYTYFWANAERKWVHDFVRWSGRSGCTTAIRFASKRRCVATTRAGSWRSRSQRFASGLLPCAHAGAGISAHVGKPGWQARQVIFKGWCRCPRHHTQLPARKIHHEIPKCALSNFWESETLKEANVGKNSIM